MRKMFRSKAGFTFVESLITFSIVGIFLALTWATVNFLILKENEQVVRTRAHFLVIEGMERVKQIQATAMNRNRENGFRETLGGKSGTYILSKNENSFTLKEGRDEKIEMNEEPYTTYCRTIDFSGEPENNPDIRKVRVTVRWGDAGNCEQEEEDDKGKQAVSYSTYIAKTSL
ncbi:prepilin-type N-terminal cleavage/methylation domain-containing protein [Candidatus Peregrinibacteria bacterium]|nr:prepilin-type N-terminal cleavage/methylation domain-containing protein [Candidatus Peregrinibacteria bacterium]